MTYTEYMSDIERYMISKFPENIPAHVAQDVSAYIAMRVAVLSNDLLAERDRYWLKEIKRYDRQLTKSLSRTKKETEE